MSDEPINDESMNDEELGDKLGLAWRVLKGMLLATWLVLVLLALWGIHGQLGGLDSKLSDTRKHMSAIKSDVSWIKTWGVEIK